MSKAEVDAGSRTSKSGARVVRAPRGTELRCKGWLPGGRAAHADEQPRSRGRRAARRSRRLRRHRARRRARGRRSTSSSRELRAARRRRDAARAVGQGGRRSRRTPTRRACSSRTRPARAGVGDLGAVPPARGAGPHDVRADDRGLVDLHRHAGDPAGHVRDVRRRGASSTSAAPWTGHAGPHRGPRRHGRRAAARGDDGGRVVPRRRGRSGAHRSAASTRATSTSAPTILDEALARVDDARATAASARERRARAATRRDVYPELVRRGVTPDLVTEQTAAHDPLVGYVPQGLTLDGGGRAARARSRRATCDARARRHGRATSRRCSRCRSAAPYAFDYGNNLREQRDGGRRRATRSTSPASCRRTSGRCSARARARSAGSRSRGDPEDIARHRRGRAARSCPTTRDLAPLDRPRAASASRSRACRRASAGSATASAHSVGPRVQRAGARRARSRRRSSSGATTSTAARSRRPNRETEAHEGRLRRDRRLADPERAREHRRRRDVGERPPRRRRRHRLLASTRAWSSSPTAPTRPRAGSSAC